jgi:hypothetical protein
MGWGLNKGLTGKDYTHAEHLWHVANRAGRRLDCMVTVTPPREIEAAARGRYIAGIRGDLGQFIQRRGRPFVGECFRENPAVDPNEVGEHATFLIHVGGTIDWLSGWADRQFDIDLQLRADYDGALDALRYALKERDARFQGLLKKEYGERGHPRALEPWEWEKPAPIMGRRWSATAALLKMDAEASGEAQLLGRRRMVTVKLPVPVVTLETFGGLLFDLPAMEAPERPKVAPKHRGKIAARHVGQGSLALRSDNIEIFDALRVLGRTDAERAAVIGLSRGQVTNLKNGQFGTRREVVRRIVTEARARGLAA